MAGKLHVELLRRYVFSRVGFRDPDVVVGPAYGEDASIIRLRDGRVLVVHSNPITGAEKRLGWLSVHIPCNDVAVRGAKPRWLLPVLLLPEDFDEGLLDDVTAQMDKAASEIGIMIVGGHTEYTVGLDRPIASVTAIGLTDEVRYVRTGGAKTKDLIAMTKSAGVEGTAILASDMAEHLKDRGVSEYVLTKARGYFNRVSVVAEALALAEVGVNAMHDPTEGGILGGLAEIAYASNSLIEVWEEKIPISEETRTICEALNIDPLRFISSGVVLAAIPENRFEEAAKRIEALGERLTVIGRVADGRGVKLHKVNGSVECVGEFVRDELFRLISSMREERAQP